MKFYVYSKKTLLLKDYFFKNGKKKKDLFKQNYTVSGRVTW